MRIFQGKLNSPLCIFQRKSKISHWIFSKENQKSTTEYFPTKIKNSSLALHIFQGKSKLTNCVFSKENQKFTTGYFPRKITFTQHCILSKNIKLTTAYFQRKIKFTTVYFPRKIKLTTCFSYYFQLILPEKLLMPHHTEG